MADFIIADQSDAILNRLREILSEDDHYISGEALTGKEVITLYKRLTPKFVLLDIEMPDIKGITVVKEILSFNPNANIIVIGSEGQDIAILKAIRSGAKHYITKPIHSQELKRAIDSISSHSDSREEVSKPDSGTSGGAKGLILIIDDSKMFRAVLTDRIQKIGHNIIAAENGKEGYDLAVTGNPDIIILDLIMPDWDGFEVLKNLKGNKQTRNIPVIMMTSDTKKENVQQAMKFGVLDYVSKDFKEEILSAKLKAALRFSNITRTKEAAHVDSNIVVTRNHGQCIITFRGSLEFKNIMEKFEKIFSTSFMGITKRDNLILDFRAVQNITSEEFKTISNIVTLIPDKKLYIIAGRYYGPIMLNVDFEDHIEVFISYGDLEIYLNALMKGQL